MGGDGGIGSAGAACVYTQPQLGGTPGKANCFCKSVSALARQFGSLSAAAAALEFPSVPALQNAIPAFCCKLTEIDNGR